MDRETFQAWLAEADGLSPRQREEAARVLAEPASLAAVVALLEARIDEARRCPHCEHRRGGDAWSLERAQALLLQGLRQDLQCVDGDAIGPAAQEGALGGVRRRARRGRHGQGGGGALRGGGQHLVPLAASLPGRGEGRQHQAQGHRRSRRNLRPDQPQRCAKARPQGRASGVASPRSAASRRSRCRSWSPRIAAARPSRPCCPTPRPRPSGRISKPRSSRMRCWSPTAPRSSRPVPEPWASPTSRSTTRPANAAAASFISTPSTAATSVSKTFLRGRRGVATKYLDSYLAWYHLAILPKLPTPRSVSPRLTG